MDAQLIRIGTREFLRRRARGEVTIPPELLTEYVTHIDKRIAKPPRSRDFTMRMSNLGRPTCQLQMDKANAPAQIVNDYQREYTFMMGDVSEIWLIMIMKAAGIPVDSYDVPVKVQLANQTISGTLDIIIDGIVYDIKTISSASFQKYTGFGGFSSFLDDDPFGYIEQGVLYSEGSGKPFGGWILINKNTGDIDVCEVPANFDQHRDAAIARAEETVRTLMYNRPFQRKFTDEEELFRKKPTGNRVLGKTCGYCDYTAHCWPDARHIPSLASEAKDKKHVWYTHTVTSEV